MHGQSMSVKLLQFNIIFRTPSWKSVTLFLWSTTAPFSIRSLTISTWPFLAAKIKAVSPSCMNICQTYSIVLSSPPSSYTAVTQNGDSYSYVIYTCRVSNLAHDTKIGNTPVYNPPPPPRWRKLVQNYSVFSRMGLHRFLCILDDSPLDVLFLILCCNTYLINGVGVSFGLQ